ncbi:mechanosensitive ion channel family protein [Compostimonas suwonensis]|uniref:Small conductance mechanosensitive channel n=1 Tax=Compostimonas suwonensis TaxID=1048394 RepID=A0A2M9C0H5_9MICO|nr:mechanosensitive ion channel domain-containing protein [Compostimonas suwonensis]PJJ63857.1 small conductance mechanosensitive channel [Compostimonas suwonensis]
MGFLNAYRVPLLIAFVCFLVTVNTIVLVAVIRRATARLVRRTGTRGKDDARGVAAHEQLVRRARTASTVAVNIVIWTQVAIAVMVILGLLGVNLTALLASAGVLAAVLTFGAQNVIKDVMAGLFMVFEDQLDVGDLVDAGMATGVVESVGIRVTQVRDLTGMLWSIRNGEIVRIGNGTRSWRRVVLDIPLTPDTEISLATKIVTSAIVDTLAQQLPSDTPSASPECVGVVAFDGSAVTVRFTAEVPATDLYRLDVALRTAARQAIIDDPALTLAIPLRVASTV